MTNPASLPNPQAPAAEMPARQQPMHSEAYRGFLEDLTEWVCRFQPDGTILYVNAAFCRFFGKTEAELVGQRWQPVAVADDVPYIAACLRTLSPANPVVVIENRVIGGDGATHWGKFVNRAFYDADGALITMQSEGRDITERKHRELELRRFNKEQQAILDSPLIGIFKVSHRRIVWANPAFAAMLGHTPEELQGQSTRMNYLSDADYDRFGQESFAVVSGGATYNTEQRQRSKDGKVGWYSVSVRMLDPGSAILLGTMADITQRKRAEAELAQHRDALESKVAKRTAELVEARDAADLARLQAEQAHRAAADCHAQLQAALDAMEDAVCICDPDGRFVHRNAAFALFHRFDTLEQCEQSLQEYPALLDIYAPDGTLIPVTQWPVPRALRGETAVNVECTLRRRDNGATWVGSYNLAPLHDVSGQVSGAVVTAREITHQKEAQIRLQQAHAAEYAGLQAKSIFLSTMSHELRTPLHAIAGMTQLLRRQTTDERQRRQLDLVLDGAARLLSLIESLLDLARIRSGAMVLEEQPFVLGGMMTTVLALGRARLGAHPQRLELAMDTELQTLRLFGDAGRLTQVLLNLTDNATKFAGQGQILLRCAVQAHAPGHVTLRLAVHDEGQPVPADERARIFLMEQGDGSTTRRHGGAGLGLAISKGLVERMGGAIGVDSAPGEGNEFWFTVRLRRADTAS